MQETTINRPRLTALIAELLASEHLTAKYRAALESWTPAAVAHADEGTLAQLVTQLHQINANVRMLEQQRNPLTAALADTPCWLVWKYGRPRKEGTKAPKIPLDPATMQPTDGATTVGKATLANAAAKLREDVQLGVTLGRYEDLQLAGFDIDNCIDENDCMDARAAAVLAACKGFAYVEISPSGRGLKGFVLGELNLRGTAGDVEVYDSNRFFTVTGVALAGYETLREPDFDELTQLQEALLRQEGVEKCEPQAGSGGDARPSQLDLASVPIAAYADPERVRKNILRFLDPAGMPYNEWINVGMALHRQFMGSDVGLDLWDEWSAQDEAGYPKRGRRDLLSHYNSFAKVPLGNKPTTLRSLLKSTEAARREATKIENRERSAHEEIPLLVERLDADDVERRFIYVSGTDSVADKDNPRAIRSFAACRNHYAASKAAVGEDGAVTNAFSLWKGRGSRETVDAVTWRPGYPQIMYNPRGESAFNTYQAFKPKAGSFVQEHADRFLAHVRLLFADRTEDFLDWLAHIEQCPGVLPHQAWLHVATQTGVGRNLLAGILGCIWGSGVAQNFDLNAALDGGFNGELSERILVIVDEIRESGAEGHRRAQKLKSLITEERRTINPKYGHKREEFNCARWLMFSNFRSAIPIEGTDRRIEVVIYDGKPMDEGYYADLYALLDDSDFIWSVKQLLATRDISGYNPGAHAKRTSHKLQAVTASRSDVVTEIVEFTEGYHWPLVSAEIVRKQLSSDPNPHQFAKLMEDAGWLRLPSKHRTRLKPQPIAIYVKREHFEEWAGSIASKNDGLPDEQAVAELLRYSNFDTDT
jgi:hypothetical protein